LPPAIAALPAPPAEAPTTGIVEIKLPEEKNECFALVPANYHPQVPYGLLVVLSRPGPIDRTAFEAAWKPVAEKHGLVVLAPQSAQADKWEPTEVEFVRKTLDDAIAHYNIDASRIATYGYQSGGSMALLVGLGNTDRVRAIAAIDAAPPARTKPPENDPVNRLALLFGTAEKSATMPQIKAVIARLEAARFPVTQMPLGEQPRELTADELSELGRWIDALDRI
jgi:predicted esterase